MSDNTSQAADSNPYRLVHGEGDPIQAAAVNAANRAQNIYASIMAGNAATLIRRALGADAHRALFNLMERDNGYDSADLIVVYNAAGQVVWHDDLDLNLDELGVAAPQPKALDDTVRTAVESCIELADYRGMADGWFTRVDLVTTTGGYDGDGEVAELYVGEEIERAATNRAIVARTVGGGTAGSV